MSCLYRHTCAALLGAAMIVSGAAAAKTPAPPTKSAPAPAPSTQPVAASQPTRPVSRGRADPFARLKVVIPKEKLPPVRSVRVRDKREQADRSREGTISISISSSPRGARVYYGRKLLGNTPLSLTAHKGSTPWDVVLKKGGYMTLHSRIRRKVSRSYRFKLSPAKIR